MSLLDAFRYGFVESDPMIPTQPTPTILEDSLDRDAATDLHDTVRAAILRVPVGKRWDSERLTAVIVAAIKGDNAA